MGQDLSFCVLRLRGAVDSFPLTKKGFGRAQVRVLGGIYPSVWVLATQDSYLSFSGLLRGRRLGLQVGFS